MDPLGNKAGFTDAPHGAAGQDHHLTGDQNIHVPAAAGLADQHHAGGLGQLGTGAQQHHGGGAAPGVLRRSGSSSSSSSSEDDGMGGRRKKSKGVKEKIKEKLPGGHKGDQHPQPHHDQGVTAGAAQAHEPEKKGIMDKIKEKLPGSH